jgi:quinoprotein glucose dehydrogenase
MRVRFAAAGVAAVWLAAAAAVGPTHAQGAGATVWDGVYSEAQAVRGQEQYDRSCAGCHGKDLGGSNTAASLVDESFAFLFEDMTLGEVLDRIRSIMPPDRPNSLSAESYCDIVAFLLKSNKMPAGARELTTDYDALNKIRITKASR